MSSRAFRVALDMLHLLDKSSDQSGGQHLGLLSVGQPEELREYLEPDVIFSQLYQSTDRKDNHELEETTGGEQLPGRRGGPEDDQAETDEEEGYQHGHDSSFMTAILMDSRVNPIADLADDFRVGTGGQ
jgi:hypothetical protein